MRHLAVTAYCLAATVLLALVAVLLHVKGERCFCPIAIVGALYFAWLTVHEARRGWPAFQIERQRRAVILRREAQMRRCPIKKNNH